MKSIEELAEEAAEAAYPTPRVTEVEGGKLEGVELDGDKLIRQISRAAFIKGYKAGWDEGQTAGFNLATVAKYSGRLDR